MDKILKTETDIPDPSGLSLRALAWILSDPPRARRFLDLTGLTPDMLRDSLERNEVQRAILDFLCAHEPDLLAAAEDLDIAPAEIATARERLAP